jgi:hypothetical protein
VALHFVKRNMEQTLRLREIYSEEIKVLYCNFTHTSIFVRSCNQWQTHLTMARSSTPQEPSTFGQVEGQGVIIWSCEVIKYPLRQLAVRDLVADSLGTYTLELPAFSADG